MSVIFDSLKEEKTTRTSKRFWLVWLPSAMLILCLAGFNIKLFFIVKDIDSKIDTEINGIFKRLDGAESVISKNLDQINSLSENTGKLRADLDMINLKISSTDTNINFMISQLNAINEFLKQGSANVNVFLDNLKQVRAEVEAMNLKIDNNNETISRLERINEALIESTRALLKKDASLIEKLETKGTIEK